MQNTAATAPLSIICIAAFIGLMLVALVFALVASRRQGKETQRLARQLGFMPPVGPDETFMQRVRELYRPTSVRRVSNLMKKVEGIGSLYIFDVMTSETARPYNSENSGTSETRNIAILSPYLDLPPFLLMQRMAAPGALGQALDNLIATGASWAGFSEYDLVPPDFNLRYALYVREDPRVERVFTSEALSALAQREHLVARGENDLLVVNNYDVRRGTNLDEQSFAAHVEEAKRVFEILSKNA
jgi:hypothetical protein